MVKVGPFIEMIKQGRRVKAGTHWLSTHKSLPLCQEAVPSACLPRIAEVLHCLAEAEKAKPSPPGQSALINIKGKAGAGFSYKWLGKDEMGKRVAIVGVRIDDQQHLSVELGGAPAAYFHQDGRVYQMEVPPELRATFSEILSRTPGKFIGEEAVQPSSGVLDQEAFKQCNCVCGLDESGRGTISGPLVVGAVLITPDSKLPVVYDSKQLDRTARQNLFSEIEQSGIAFVYSVDTVFVYENYPTEAATLSGADGLTITELANRDFYHYPLTVQAVPGDELDLRIQYRTDVFDEAAIAALAEHFNRVLVAMTTDPARPVSSLDTRSGDLLIARRPERQTSKTPTMTARPRLRPPPWKR